MKFINYLQTITGVGIYPLSSLLIFFIFFLTLTIWVIKADKTYVNAMKHLPFHEDENDSIEQNKKA